MVNGSGQEIDQEQPPHSRCGAFIYPRSRAGVPASVPTTTRLERQAFHRPTSTSGLPISVWSFIYPRSHSCVPSPCPGYHMAGTPGFAPANINLWHPSLSPDLNLLTELGFRSRPQSRLQHNWNVGFCAGQHQRQASRFCPLRHLHTGPLPRLQHAWNPGFSRANINILSPDLCPGHHLRTESGLLFVPLSRLQHGYNTGLCNGQHQALASRPVPGPSPTHGIRFAFPALSWPLPRLQHGWNTVFAPPNINRYRPGLCSGRHLRTE